MATTKTVYQTSFRVDSKTEDSALFLIQKIVYNWIIEKEETKISTKGDSNFFRKTEIKNSNTRSTVCTRFLLDDDFFVWGCEYFEFPNMVRGKLLTEIILKELKSSKTVIAYVNISLIETSGNVTDWKPTVPRFIRRIVSSKDLDVYSGDKSFKVGFQPIIVKCGQGKILRDWIDSESRKYPIFVFNNSSDHNVTDCAYNMARTVIGKAQVFLLDNDRELMEELSIVANKALYCVKIGFLKLFYPKYGTFIRTEYFSIYDDIYRTLSTNITKFILRDLIVRELGAITSFKQIIDAIKISKLLRDNKENSSANKEDIKKLIWENENLKSKNDDLKSELNQVTKYWEEEAHLAETTKNDLSSAKSKIEALNFQLENKDDKILELFRKQGIPTTLSLIDICVLFKILYHDRIAIPELVTDSLPDCKFDDLQIFWEMLSSLSNDLFEMKFVNAASELNKIDRVGRFEYTATEGKMTNKDKKLMAFRKINYNNKEYDISPHIKYGTKHPKCIRIHFAFDDKLQKIILGFIGDHLPNYTGKTR